MNNTNDQHTNTHDKSVSEKAILANSVLNQGESENSMEAWLEKWGRRNVKRVKKDREEKLSRRGRKMKRALKRGVGIDEL